MNTINGGAAGSDEAQLLLITRVLETAIGQGVDIHVMASRVLTALTGTPGIDHLEEWRPVVGWEGKYSVSNLGRVRSDTRMIERKARGAMRVRNRILAVNRRPGPGGSLRVRLFDTTCGRASTGTIHMMVAEAFLGPRPPNSPRPPKEAVEHLNGDVTDNRAVNLRWALPTYPGAKPPPPGPATAG